MRIGVLALQGAVAPHLTKLEGLGVTAAAVRSAEELFACEGLIVPGGESTTFLRLIGVYSLRQPLLDFAARRPLWGICAGAILMAKEVVNPPQDRLGIMSVTVQRNGYGRQNESFIGEGQLQLPGQPALSQEMVFIRAPRMIDWEKPAQALGVCQGETVALRCGAHLCTTFHPELSAPNTLHHYFLKSCVQGDTF